MTVEVGFDEAGLVEVGLAEVGQIDEQAELLDDAAGPFQSSHRVRSRHAHYLLDCREQDFLFLALLVFVAVDPRSSFVSE